MWSKTRVVFDGVKNNLKFTFSTLYENSAIFPPEEFEALWSRVPEACQLVHRFTLRINESDGKPQISEAMFRHLESKEKGNIFNNLVTCAAGYIPDYLGGGNILQSQKEVQETLQIFKGLKAACFPLRPQVRKGWTTSLTGLQRTAVFKSIALHYSQGWLNSSARVQPSLRLSKEANPPFKPRVP